MVEEILKAEKEQRVIFGTKKTIKALKNNAVEKIYLASNCPEHLKKTLKSLADLDSIQMIELDKDSEEFSASCKKPFSISVACILKQRE